MLPPRSMLTIKNPTRKVLVFSLALLLWLAGCGQPGPRALWDGKRLLDQGKWEPAIEKLKSATTLMPTNALAFNYLGLALHHADRPVEAERAYFRALALDRDLVEVRYNLGCLWLSQNKLDQARSELTAYTLRRGLEPEGWLRLGQTQLRLREPAAAEKSFYTALRLSTNNAEALNGLGLVRLQRKRVPEAAQFFSKAVQVQPDYSPALINLAVVAQEHLKDRQLALKHYRRLLALKPAPPNAASIQAIVHSLEQELKPPPPPPTLTTNPPQARTELALAKTGHPEVEAPGSPGKPAPARPAPPQVPAATNTVTAPTPKIAPTTNPAKSLSLTSTNVSKPPVSSEATAKPPQRPEVSRPSATTTLAQTSAPAADRAPARPPPAEPTPAGGVSFPRFAYKSPSKPAPGNHSEAQRAFAQGVQAHEAQRLPEAIQAYRRAIQLDPAFFDAYYNLGLAATASGNVSLALTTYETALALRPEALDARYKFALLLKQAGYPLDAVNELQKILATYPNESRAHLALGNLYAQQLGKPAQARPHYLKVLETDPRNPQAAAVRYWLTDNPP